MKRFSSKETDNQEPKFVQSKICHYHLKCHISDMQFLWKCCYLSKQIQWPKQLKIICIYHTLFRNSCFIPTTMPVCIVHLASRGAIYWKDPLVIIWLSEGGVVKTLLGVSLSALFLYKVKSCCNHWEHCMHPHRWLSSDNFSSAVSFAICVANFLFYLIIINLLDNIFSIKSFIVSDFRVFSNDANALRISHQ